MRRRGIAISVVALFGVTSWFWAQRGRAGDAPKDSVTPTARQRVEVKVYKDDFGMVSEQRPMQLIAGSNRLYVRDVSKQLDPQSVLLRWPEEGANSPQLVAHAYDLGVESGDALLKRYLGQEVEVVRYGENGHEAERNKGVLMVEGNGNVVLQADGKFLVNPPGTLVAPTNPNIVTIPQLSVQAESPSAQSAALDVTYLTRGLSWSADYVATLAPQGDSLNLECWATVTNRTGADYPDARVTLMAGSPNRAVTAASSKMVAGMMPAKDDLEVQWRTRGDHMARRMAFAAPEVAGDFHAYPIKNPTTIVQEQMNRLLMLSSAKVSVLKDYSAQLPPLSAWDDGYFWGAGAQPTRGSVAVALTFFNREKDGLGEPLPSGAIRFYEPDAAGSLRYVGAANIEDTPRDQKVYLTLSSAFDVFTEWKAVKQERRNKHTLRKSAEAVLHNEKTTPVTLRVVQPFNGRWKLVEETAKHITLDANRIQWTVTIPAGGQATLRYTTDLME